MTVEFLKIGARGSPLSLAQSSAVGRAIEAANPGVKVEIIPIKTTGDKITDAPLASIGGKGLFVKEIEEALLRGDISLAIHSAKDMPAELPKGLILGPTPPRADFRDALITRHPGGLEALPKGAKVGTSGLRRQAQLLAARPDLQIAPMRGNVGTRLKKLENEFEATLLAVAGLARLGVSPPNCWPLEPDLMLPAAGQGVLALEIRADDRHVAGLLAPLHHEPTALALAAERGFLKELGSGCQLPVAALARLENGLLCLDGLVASLDGRKVIRKRRSAAIKENAAAAAFGSELAKEILNQGGREIMAALPNSNIVLNAV